MSMVVSTTIPGSRCKSLPGHEGCSPLACDQFKPQPESLLHFSVTTSIYQQQHLYRPTHHQLSDALFLLFRQVFVAAILALCDGSCRTRWPVRHALKTRFNALTGRLCFTASTLITSSLGSSAKRTQSTRPTRHHSHITFHSILPITAIHIP
jgi:hypothetical protein